MSNNGGNLTVQYNLRWSEEMRDKIAIAAKENTRSMNQEIVARLEESFIETIPANSMFQIVAAFFMGLLSRYEAEKIELKKLSENDPENEDILRKLIGCDYLIEEARNNIKRLTKEEKAP